MQIVIQFASVVTLCNVLGTRCEVESCFVIGSDERVW